MPLYRVQIARSAIRQLARIRRGHRAAADRIDAAIRGLASDPRPSGCAKLQGNDDLYRIRVGTYRVIYVLRDAQCLVIVVRIATRQGAYR